MKKRNNRFLEAMTAVLACFLALVLLMPAVAGSSVLAEPVTPWFRFDFEDGTTMGWHKEGGGPTTIEAVDGQLRIRSSQDGPSAFVQDDIPAMEEVIFACDFMCARDNSTFAAEVQRADGKSIQFAADGTTWGGHKDYYVIANSRAGTWIPGSDYEGPKTNQIHHMELKVTGGNAEGWIDGQCVLTTPAEGSSSAPGGVAFTNWLATDVYVDNIYINCGRVSGVVMADGAPLSGARVTVYDASNQAVESTVSAGDGSYMLHAPVGQQCRVEANSMGVSAEQTVSLSFADHTARVNLELSGAEALTSYFYNFQDGTAMGWYDQKQAADMASVEDGRLHIITNSDRVTHFVNDGIPEMEEVIVSCDMEFARDNVTFGLEAQQSGGKGVQFAADGTTWGGNKDYYAISNSRNGTWIPGPNYEGPKTHVVHSLKLKITGGRAEGWADGKCVLTVSTENAGAPGQVAFGSWLATDVYVDNVAVNCGTVRGQVLYRGVPVEGLTVEASCGKSRFDSAVTDADGAYLLRVPLNRDCTVSAGGKEVTVKADFRKDELDQDLILEQQIPVDISNVEPQNDYADGQPKAGYTGTPTASRGTPTFVFTYSGRGDTHYGPTEQAPSAPGSYVLEISTAPDCVYSGRCTVEFILTEPSAEQLALLQAVQTVQGREYRMDQYGARTEALLRDRLQLELNELLRDTGVHTENLQIDVQTMAKVGTVQDTKGRDGSFEMHVTLAIPGMQRQVTVSGVIAATAYCPDTREGRIYYVSSSLGDDRNDGLTPDTPWKTVEGVNGCVFYPGDSILFRRGDVWSGNLIITASGSEQHPVVFGAYGSSKERPLLQGLGDQNDGLTNSGTAAILIDSCEYVKVSGLEITNIGVDSQGNPNTFHQDAGSTSVQLGEGLRNGIMVRLMRDNQDRTYHNIEISDNVVHHVKGWSTRSSSGGDTKDTFYYTGGIYVYVEGDGQGTTARIDGLRIENNQIHDVTCEGINFAVDDEPYYNFTESKYHTNVVIRGNTIARTGSDVLLVRFCKGPMVSHNVGYDAGYYGSADRTCYIAGMWQAHSYDTTFQYNECARTRTFYGDGHGFDLDWGSGGYALYQYNYTHENQGGMVFEMNEQNQGKYDRFTFRYNLSVNDGNGGGIGTVGSTRVGKMDFYNNTVYMKPGMQMGINRLNSPEDNHFWNNIFVADQISVARHPSMEFDTNLYFTRGNGNPVTDDANALYADPMFLDTSAADAFTAGSLDGWDKVPGWQLRRDSVALSTGRAIANHGGHDILDRPVSAPHLGAFAGCINVPGVNMTLGNELSMNFMVRKSDVTDLTGLSLQITKTFADGREPVVITVPAGSWKDYNKDFYAVKFTDISAKEMTDDITAVVLRDGKPAGDVYTESVEDYALRILRGEQATAQLKAVIVDMLNYGAEAQKYFEYHMDAMANANLTAEEKALASAPIAAQNVQVKGDRYFGSNLNLGNSMTMTVYFKGITPDMHAVVSYTKHTGEKKEISVNGADFVRYNDTVYGIRTTTLVVADAQQPVTVTVYDANNQVVASGTDSIASYVARSTTVGELGQAILKLASSAEVYFANR